jgi:hypothetical protein
MTTQLITDIHHYDQRLAVALTNLEQDKKVLESNRKKIKQFLEYIHAEGLSIPRQVRYVYVLRKVSRLLGKEFYRTTKTDMVTLVSELEKQNTAYDTYWLSIRFHKSGTQLKSLSRPAFEKPRDKSNIKVYEQPVSRGGRGKWSVYVFPHLDSAMYADERLRKGMLRYAIVITVISDRRREVYAPINRYNRTLSPIRPLVAPARSKRVIETAAR